jgi:hypothetical protein
VSVSDSDAERRSLSFLFQQLWNSSLEWESLVARPRGCVRSLPASVSLPSVDRLLSDATFCIESEDALFELILGLGCDYFGLPRHLRWDRSTRSLPPAFARVGWVALDDALWAGVSDLVRTALGFAFLIPADLPALFAEFGGKRFTLLWRGSRDGFGPSDFHGRCNDRAPTLTLIQDTERNIFGASRRWSGSREPEAGPSASGPIRV